MEKKEQTRKRKTKEDAGREAKDYKEIRKKRTTIGSKEKVEEIFRKPQRTTTKKTGKYFA